MTDDDQEHAPVDFHAVLKHARRIASRDRFWAIRGKAVSAYAKLEQALCRVFADVSEMSDERAAIIFFRIASASARNDILDKLTRLHYDGKYNRFWNSTLKAIRPLDRRRNEIVHWSVATELAINVNGLAAPRVLLRPPTFWSRMDHADTQLSTDDLRNFIKACDFYSTLITNFSWINSWQMRRVVPPSPAQTAAWQRIFHEPPTYPLPAGIRLPRNPIIPGNPPRPSRA